MSEDFWKGYVPEPATYTFKPTSEPVIAAFNMKPNYNITLHRDGKQIGALDFNGPEMTFTGDADESAKVFFDFIARTFKQRLEQERADEREACEALHDHEDVLAPIGNSAWGEAYQEGWGQGTAAYRNAIRARSNT